MERLARENYAWNVDFWRSFTSAVSETAKLAYQNISP